jgi:hypothetical protein
MFGAAYAFKKIYSRNGLQTTMYSTLSDEESESSVFISVYAISHDSGNTSDTDSNEVSETLIIVMEKFGSEPRSEPEPNRTERYFRVRVQVLTRTGPSVPFRVRVIPEPFRMRSERVLNPNR